tara:strand:+ start:155 stop:385 length:231 start_codon:yes stop_codon:yes gene_type:complete
MSLKESQKSLRQWTKQDWGTKSGKKSADTGERYLPKAARKALTNEEYASTTAAKRRGNRQYVPQPKKIAEKTAKYR